MLLNQVCYRTLDCKKPWTLEAYESIGGYSIWKKILTTGITPANIIKELKLAALRGRGGAGFPTDVKLELMRKQKSTSGQKYTLCNLDEGEPGAFKDRDILRYNPHQLIEGMAIIGYVTGATVGYNYIRGEFFRSITTIEMALAEARKLKLIGENILGSGINFQLHNFYGAGSYICGEETALIESLEGKRGLPRVKPPYPAEVGLFGCPSIINNAETVASIPVILEKGGQWYRDIGTGSGGYKIFSISGHVQKPGNYEVPIGTSFNKLLELAGGVADGKRLKAVIPGGISTAVLPADVIMSLNMDYEPLIQAGSALGTGSIIVMHAETCMVRVLARIVRFYFNESCGQCTPCREGIGWLVKLLQRLITGQGSMADIALLDEVANKIASKTICALGDAVVVAVKSFLKHFHTEFTDYVKS